MIYNRQPLVVHRPDSFFIELTIDEWERSCLMGTKRHVASERARLNLRFGSKRDILGDITSMHAEHAFAIFSGEHWHQIERDATDLIENAKGPDVGTYQVRHAFGARNSSLIIRDNDRDDEVFVLVLGQHRLYEITGCIRAKDAKQSRWRCAPDKSRPDAWMIPCVDLNPVHSLQLPNKDRFSERETVSLVRSAWKEKYGNLSKAS